MQQGLNEITFTANEAQIGDRKRKPFKFKMNDGVMMLNENAKVIKVNDSESSIGSEEIVFYGNPEEVKAIKNIDYNDFVNLEKVSQDPKNFDKAYTDLVDYIVKITHKIWEEKSIGLIYDTYHNNVAMHFGSVSAYGIQSVISGTLQTLYAFPDRRLIAQDVIWSEHGEGYLSSHRILSTATNLNQSCFGPATNKKINFRTMVDCAVENNRIYEEWLVRDNLWICEQLGYDPHEIAKGLAAECSGYDTARACHFGINENMRGQLSPELYTAKDHSIGEYVLEMLSKLYNYRLFDQVRTYYSEQAVLHYICDADLTGHSQIQGMLISLFSSFPNAVFKVDRVTCNVDPTTGEDHVAVRWRLSGLHEGLGIFGSPTNNPVEILGITHYTFNNKKITEEWVTFDGLDVLKQIYTRPNSSESPSAF